MVKPVIIIGGGGHSRVLLDILQLNKRNVIGITEQKFNKDEINGINILGSDEEIYNYKRDEVELVNGIGSVQSTQKRKQLFCSFKEKGYSFATLIHPSAIIASNVKLGEGVQVMAGSIIQPGSEVGNNTIINTKTSIDHDCMVGSHVHIAPGCTLSGNVIVNDEVHIGTSASIIQKITIGSNALIGAGTIVLKNVSPNSKVIGNPGREVKK